MDRNEEYAYKIGKIVGKYIHFKKHTEKTNSSPDKLTTLSNYNQETLRDIYTEVCNGICLSETNQAEIDEIYAFIKENTPTEEIADSKKDEDYSYFFYEGLFENI